MLAELSVDTIMYPQLDKIVAFDWSMTRVAMHVKLIISKHFEPTRREDEILETKI